MKVEMDLREDGHWVGIRLYPEDAKEMSQLKMLEKYTVPVKFEEIYGNFNPYNLLITVMNQAAYEAGVKSNKGAC